MCLVGHPIYFALVGLVNYRVGDHPLERLKTKELVFKLPGEAAALCACSTWNLCIPGAWLPDVDCVTLVCYQKIAQTQYGVGPPYPSIVCCLPWLSALTNKETQLFQHHNCAGHVLFSCLCLVLRRKCIGSR